MSQTRAACCLVGHGEDEVVFSAEGFLKFSVFKDISEQAVSLNRGNTATESFISLENKHLGTFWTSLFICR